MAGPRSDPAVHFLLSPQNPQRVVGLFIHASQEKEYCLHGSSWLWRRFPFSCRCLIFSTFLWPPDHCDAPPKAATAVDGLFVGEGVGATVGCTVATVGVLEGDPVGVPVFHASAIAVGGAVGLNVALVGECVGNVVGEKVSKSYIAQLLLQLACM